MRTENGKRLTSNRSLTFEVNVDLKVSIDSNFTARVAQDYPPLQRQATNNQTELSQLQNTELNLLTVTFLAMLKWTEAVKLALTDRRRQCKKGKRLTIIANF